MSTSAVTSAMTPAVSSNKIGKRIQYEIKKNGCNRYLYPEAYDLIYKKEDYECEKIVANTLKRSRKYSASFELWINSLTFLKKLHHFYRLDTNLILKPIVYDGNSKFVLVMGRSNLKNIFVQARIINIDSIDVNVSVYARPINPTLLQQNQTVLDVIPYETHLDNFFLFEYVMFMPYSTHGVVLSRNYLYSISMIIVPPLSKKKYGTGLRIHDAYQNTNKALVICPLDINPSCSWTVDYTLISSDDVSEIIITFINFTEEEIYIPAYVPFAKMIKLDLSLVVSQHKVERPVPKDLNIKTVHECIIFTTDEIHSSVEVNSGYSNINEPRAEISEFDVDLSFNMSLKLLKMLDSSIF